MAELKEKIVNLEDLKTAMQIFYDMIYPVGKVVIAMPGESVPTAPKNITAVWKDVSADYDGRYFKIDSSKSSGTLINEAITIDGTSLTVDQMPAHDHRATTYDNVGYTDWRGDHYHYHEGGVTVYETQKGSGRQYLLATVDNYEGGKQFYNATTGGHWHQAISNGKGQPHVHTAKGITPASVTIKIYKRVS